MEIEILEKSEERARFILRDSTRAFANSLRRTILTEVPCMAIDEVMVEENESIMTDEMLTHRLSLIPLKTDLKAYVLPSKCKCRSEEGCSRCRVTLTLECEAKESPMTVYSRDLKSEDPAIVPVSPDIPIIKLATGQKIKLKAFAKLGLGKDHAKWQPVSVCVYKFMPIIEIDSKKCDLCGKCVNVCPRKVLSIEDEKIKVVKLFDCTLCRDCMDACPMSAISVSWDGSTFIFNLESTGTLPISQLVVKAAEVLREKVNELKKALGEE